MSHWYRKPSSKPGTPDVRNVVGTRSIPSTAKDLYPLWPYTVERDSRGKKHLRLHKGPKPGSGDWHKEANAWEKQQRDKDHQNHTGESDKARERQAAPDSLEGRVKVETEGDDGAWYPEQRAHPHPNPHHSQGHHGPGVRTAEPVDPWTGAPMDYIPGSHSRPGSRSSRLRPSSRPASGVHTPGIGMPRPVSGMPHHLSGVPQRTSGMLRHASGMPGSYHPPYPPNQ